MPSPTPRGAPLSLHEIFCRPSPGDSLQPLVGCAWFLGVQEVGEALGWLCHREVAQPDVGVPEMAMQSKRARVSTTMPLGGGGLLFGFGRPSGREESPLGLHRSVRDDLSSYGSCRSGVTRRRGAWVVQAQ